MKEKFIEKKFTNKSLAKIEQANSIIDEYQSQGLSLTLRQLYYQFVARDLMANKQKNYKSLGSLLSNARLAGLTDWKSMEDRTRGISGGDYGDHSVHSFMAEVSSGYSRHWWDGQETYVEVWVEKEALAGVVERACRKYRVPFFSCRGYTSQSEQYKAGKRFEYHSNILDKSCHLLHLGDHDPSGIDMTRDNDDRLQMFAPGTVTIERMALNMDQIIDQKPPPNPAKESDSRHGKYKERYGSSSWELDALNPDFIDNLIENRIKELIDLDKFYECQRQEDEDREEIDRVANNYDEILNFLNENGY
jgi:hypothetical protein